MRNFRYWLLLLGVVLPLEGLFAWGQEGHRIIAAVAYDNLTHRARKGVDKVLGKRGIIYYANWPDEIKSDTIYPTSYDWHFQDLDADMSDSALIATLTDYPSVGGKLWRATDSITAVLQHDRTEVDALKFIVHFYGDRFCPVHTAHISDLGGNKVIMQWFHQKTNLHTVWDSKLIDSQGYSYSEYARRLQDKYGAQKKYVMQMSREDELRYNYALTESIYAYQQTWDGNTYHYIYHFVPALEWQLYAAGIKLAQLLNGLYR